MFWWTCSSLCKATFKHLNFHSVSVQTVEAYFNHGPWNRIWNFAFYCLFRDQVILFPQPEKKVYLITTPTCNIWERKSQISRWAVNKVSLYTQTLQYSLCSRTHTGHIWIMFFSLPSASSFLARPFPYYISYKGPTKVVIVSLNTRDRRNIYLGPSSSFSPLKLNV